MHDPNAAAHPGQHPVGVNCSAVDAVMTHSESTGSKRLVLLAIARFINADSQEAYPSNETIRRLAGCGDVSTVKRAITDLITSGELERDLQASPLGTNVYRLPKLGGWGGLPPELHCDSPLVFSTNDDLVNNMKSSRGESPSPGRSPADPFALQLSFEFADALIAAGRKKQRFRSDAATSEWYWPFEKLLFENFPRCGVECFRAVVARAAEPLPDGTLIYHPSELVGNNWRDLEHEWRAAQPPPPPSVSAVAPSTSEGDRRRYYELLIKRDPTERDREELAAIEGAALAGQEAG